MYVYDVIKLSVQTHMLSNGSLLVNTRQAVHVETAKQSHCLRERTCVCVCRFRGITGRVVPKHRNLSASIFTFADYFDVMLQMCTCVAVSVCSGMHTEEYMYTSVCNATYACVLMLYLSMYTRKL